MTVLAAMMANREENWVWKEWWFEGADSIGPCRRSPFPQRPMEPGDRVLVTLPRPRHASEEWAYEKFNGLSGEIADYGTPNDSYVVSGTPLSDIHRFPIKREFLFQFDYEWSGT